MPSLAKAIPNSRTAISRRQWKLKTPPVSLFTFTSSLCFLNHDHNGETSFCRTIAALRAYSANNRGSLSFQWIRLQDSRKQVSVRTELLEERDHAGICRYTHHRMLSRLGTVRQQCLQCVGLLRLHADGLVLLPTFAHFDSRPLQVTQSS
jgi:uncharacterized alpha-E superfamily protein